VTLRPREPASRARADAQVSGSAVTQVRVPIASIARRGEPSGDICNNSVTLHGSGTGTANVLVWDGSGR